MTRRPSVAGGVWISVKGCSVCDLWSAAMVAAPGQCRDRRPRRRPSPCKTRGRRKFPRGGARSGPGCPAKIGTEIPRCKSDIKNGGEPVVQRAFQGSEQVQLGRARREIEGAEDRRHPSRAIAGGQAQAGGAIFLQQVLDDPVDGQLEG